MKVVIDGAGEVGSHLAKLLSKEGNEVTVMDNDEKRLDALSASADVGVVEGEPSSIPAMRRAGVDQCDLFIAVFPHVNQEVNIVACMFAKKLGAKKVVARIHNDLLGPDPKKIIREAGIDRTFGPEKIASDVIGSYIRRGLT